MDTPPERLNLASATPEIGPAAAELGSMIQPEPSAGPARSPSIAVCIATFRRPAGLRRLLRSLGELEFAKSQLPDWRIVIVDNDSSSPVQDLVDVARETIPVPVLYYNEPRRGIATVRNRAVQLAGQVDFVAFIDDDEVADRSWLDELLCVRARYSADVVNGPVIPRFEQPAPTWILRGRFHRRRRLATGARITWANTGNVLIRTSWLWAVPGPFAEDLNLTGGEDSLFFAQIHRMGAKMVWADQALVEEYHPPSRMTAGWLLRRAYRKGGSSTVCERLSGSSLQTTGIGFLQGVKHILSGCLLLVPLSLLLGYAGIVRSLVYIAVGVGEIGGLTGRAYMEYEQTHGS